MENNGIQKTLGDIFPAIKEFSDFRVVKNNPMEIVFERRRWLIFLQFILTVGPLSYFYYFILSGFNFKDFSKPFLLILAFLFFIPLVSSVGRYLMENGKALLFGERYEISRYNGSVLKNGKKLALLSDIESVSLVKHRKTRSNQSWLLQFKLRNGDFVSTLSTIYRLPLIKLAENVSTFLGVTLDKEQAASPPDVK